MNQRANILPVVADHNFPSSTSMAKLVFEEPVITNQPQMIRLLAPRDIRVVEIQILPAEGETRSRWIEMQCVRYGGDGRIFQGEVPPQFVCERRPILIHLRSSSGETLRTLPTDGPILSGVAPLYFAHGQVFLYQPRNAFSAPEIRNIEWSPNSFRRRKVHVLLPRSYRENRGNRYPLLIAQDGQNLFHPGSHFGSWDLDLTTSRLISRGEIPEIIVAAVDNTEDRFAEYTPEYGRVRNAHGRGGEFLAAMRDELLPMMRKRFRISDDLADIGHMGSSLGGLLGFHASHDFRDTFGVVAAISPSFWVSLPENLRRAGIPPSHRARVWIDSGCAGRNSDGYANTVQVRDTMLEHGYVMGSRFIHVVGLGHEHNESDWARRAPDILRWMFPPPTQAPPMAPLDDNLVFV